MISKKTPDIVEGSFIPSPCGVLVFKTNRGTGDKLIIDGMFPSPYGVLVFKTVVLLSLQAGSVSFRPLTGYRSLRRVEEIRIEEIHVEFPSPYGVLVFKTFKDNAVIAHIYPFPSPYGVLVFKTLSSTKPYLYSFAYRFAWQSFTNE